MIAHQKNRLKRLLAHCVICSCCMSCGTLGGIGNGKYFPTSKKYLEIAIDSLYSKQPEYKVPKKWEIYNSWSERGYDFLEGKIFYFRYPPEEMYYVTFIGDSTALADTTKVGIGIQAVYNENNHGKWLLNNDLSSKEKERIEKRFDNEIISKLEKYTKTKVLKK